MTMITWHAKTYEELTKDELYQIIQLRIAIFIIDQGCPYQDCDGKDQKSIHLFGVENGEIIVYCRVLPGGVSYDEPSIGRVVTAISARGRGLGHHLMYLAQQIGQTYFGTTTCRISAQSYLIPFYEKWGFQVVSEEYIEDGLPHTEMLRP